MTQVSKNWCNKTNLLVGISLLLLIFLPGQIHAQEDWPPFSFGMTPLYREGKITYNIRFSPQVEDGLSDVTINIPLPEGTRFVEAGAESSVVATFDGTQVTFFSAAVHRSIREAFFTVEVTDSASTVFSTHAWLSWKGNQPGDYLTGDTSVDITQQPLNWTEPPRPRLLLQASATVTNTDIIYTIYPQNVSNVRMWDLIVTLPVPEGAEFLSAEAPPPFVFSFDGQNVSFFTLEMGKQAEIAPLRVRVAANNATEPFLVTHVGATWKNAGRQVGQSIEVEESTRTGDIVVQPGLPQLVVSDMSSDTPFSNYDLTSVTLQDVLQGGETTLKATFYTSEPLQVGAPLDFVFWIDSDCRLDTGQPRRNIAADYRITYNHEKGAGELHSWNTQEERWQRIDKLNSRAGGKMATTWIPYHLINTTSNKFCWLAQARYKTETFNPSPPSDWTPHWEEFGPVEYESLATPIPEQPDIFLIFYGAEEGVMEAGIEATSEIETETLNLEADTTISSLVNITGKLAVPVDNGHGHYNIHIFSLPAGHEIAEIPNARQPHFRFDGQTMLMNREGDGLENIFEYSFVDGTEKQISDASQDGRPFYSPDADRVVYDNPERLISVYGQYKPFIFIQCSLLPPHQEVTPQCRDITRQGVLIPAYQIMLEIQGSHPIWVINNMIAYRGCNTWAKFDACGIHLVPSSSVRRFGNGSIPIQLTKHFSDTPADTKDNLIAFSTQRDGDWEAYVVNLDGTQIRNLSNSPGSNDGLPTISPDGNRVIFMSDRQNRWAIWVVPITGGAAQKLFDLPANIFWGLDNQDWINERISWSPIF